MAPAISAHRGGNEAFPEQTYEAFAHAATSGAEYVEFDVRRLADGALVCFHDAGVETLTYRDLCARVGYEVPLLGPVMELLAGRTTGHIDLKEIGYESDVVDMAVRILGTGGFVVTSMAEISLRRIASVAPTALSIGRGLGDVPARQLPAAIVGDLFPTRRVRRCGATGVAINRRLAPWVLGRCVRDGISTIVWTVDRVDQIDQLLRDPRVDVLVTNRPLLALERRRALA